MVLRSKINAILVIFTMLIAPNLFANMKTAQKLYRKKEYVDAAALFYQVYRKSSTGNPRKYKAEWMTAQSLKKIKLYYSASKFLSRIVRRGVGRKNKYFRQAMEDLGRINNRVNLGQSHIVQLFKTRINPANIPGPARGFYFYYKGIESFSVKRFKSAKGFFKRVQSKSQYFSKAQFHLGVIENLSGNHSKGISYFRKVIDLAEDEENGDWLTEQSNLNIARIYYETKKYRDAIAYYARIPRASDNWLQALFEASWAFFIMEKSNNTLGNIHTLHSPFFDHRFFPESYILQSVTFLRLCRYDRVKKSMNRFKKRYKPVLKDIKSLLSRTENNSRKFFKIVYEYNSGSLRSYQNAWEILDALSRTDSYKQAGTTINFASKELAILSRAPKTWKSVGLLSEIKSFLVKKKIAAKNDTGRRLYRQAVGFYKYLIELSNQTKLITAELLLGKVDALRSKMKIKTSPKKGNFIGGMKRLKIGQDLEYWPFEGEYWEDELGGYVYNVASKCGRRSSK